MKDLPPKEPLTDKGALPVSETAHPEHITPESEAGTEPRAHRRTTVTVERETLSVFTRRSVVELAATTAKSPTSEEIGLTPSDKHQPEAPLETLNQRMGDKP